MRMWLILSAEFLQDLHLFAKRGRAVGVKLFKGKIWVIGLNVLWKLVRSGGECDKGAVAIQSSLP